MEVGDVAQHMDATKVHSQARVIAFVAVEGEDVNFLDALKLREARRTTVWLIQSCSVLDFE
jgi:hypothetical protein